MNQTPDKQPDNNRIKQDWYRSKPHDRKPTEKTRKAENTQADEITDNSDRLQNKTRKLSKTRIRGLYHIASSVFSGHVFVIWLH